MAGKLIAARYRLAERLGQGGMGVVHRAVDERLGRPVAVKLLEPQGAAADGLVARFEREARLAGGLQHHGITTVHDFGAEAGALYLVMELVSGQDLGRRVRGSGPLPADLVIAFFRQIADALGHAHGQGVVHRDLKPANVMVTAAEMIKICDFGIARFVLDASKDGLTQTGAVIGTPSYMSPEQATGRPIDHRTDLYSLGCLAYELLTGRPPFTADNWMGIVHQHINTAPEPPGGRGVALPRHLEELVLALLAKEPADRPADAAEVIRRLDGTAPRPRPVPEPGRAPEPERPEPEPPGPAPLSDPPAVAVRRGPRPEGPHEVLWTAEAFGAYPAVAPDAGIVICAGYHMIWALDMATGAVRWTVEDERSLFWIPTVGHGSVYLAGDQGVLSARDLGTGAEMWSVRRPALWWSELLAITPEKVIITSGNDKAKDGLRDGVWWVEALDTATGECQWRSRGMLRHSRPAASHAVRRGIRPRGGGRGHSARHRERCRAMAPSRAGQVGNDHLSGGRRAHLRPR
ncbi:hypothetical protein GCM10009735_20800 [Actinomadura chokoriensis]